MANGGVEHFQIGRAQHGVVVEARPVAQRAKDVEHHVVTKGVPEPVKSVDDEDAAFVAPLEPVHGGEQGGPILQHFVAAVGREKSVALGTGQTLGDFGGSMRESEQPQHRNPSFRQLNGEVNHRMRVWCVEEIHASGGKRLFVGDHRRPTAMFGGESDFFDVLQTGRSAPRGGGQAHRRPPRFAVPFGGLMLKVQDAFGVV